MQKKFIKNIFELCLDEYESDLYKEIFEMPLIYLLKYSNSIIVNHCGIINKKYLEKDNDKIKELYSKEFINESLIEDAGIINCIKEIKEL